MAPPLTEWTARDGKTLPCKYWPGEPRNPKGVIICIHGLSGAASDFWPVGESFPQKGYAVYGLQLRGQGNDPDVRHRGDIRSASQWQHDLLDFTVMVSRRHPGIPVYWFGESLGALIAINTTGSLGEDQTSTVHGLILTSPVVSIRDNLKLPPFKNFLLRAAIRVWPWKHISLERLGNSEVKVTSATTHREQMQHTGHYVRDFTIRLFGQIEKLILNSTPSAARISVPVLVFYTPNDALTPREGVESFFRNIASRDKTSVFFPESYHLILHDRDRDEALKRLAVWLESRATPGSASPGRK